MSPVPALTITIADGEITIDAELLQSASLTASWLGFYEKPEQRLPIIPIDCFEQAGDRRFPPTNIEASRCPTWLRSNLEQFMNTAYRSIRPWPKM